MWKNQGSWNFFHTKLIPNSSIYIQPLATIHHVNIESIMIEASDQGDHAESKPNPFEEDQVSDWDEWEREE